MQDFVHLHVHTQYSILDGQASIPRLVDKAIADGMKGIAVTDHGDMFGIKEFFNYVNKKNGGTNGEIKDLKKKIAGLEKGTVECENPEAELAVCREQLEAAKKKLFKPIFGCEMYVARRRLFNKEGKPDQSGYHLVVLAKNEKGYHNLIKLVSKAWTKQLVHGRKMIHFQYFKENDQRGQNEHRRIFNIGGRERGIGSIYYCRITSYNENKWSNAPDQ